MMIPLICIPILLFGAQSAGIDAFYALEEEEVEIPPIYTINEVTDSRSDYLTENSQEVVDIEVPEENYRLIWFNATVTWRDETTNYMQGTNEPDEFKVTIIAPNSEEKQSDFSFNPQGGEGSVEVSFGLDYEEAGFRDNYLGTWTVIVEAGQCGDDSAFFPIGGIRTTSDNGNEWTLEYKYEYYEKVEE